MDCDFLRLPIRQEFETILLKKDDPLAMIPEYHPLADYERFPITSFENQPFIMLEKGGSYEITELPDQYSVKPDIRKGTSEYFFRQVHGLTAVFFDGGWTSSNIGFTDAMEITITNDPSGTYNYLSREYRTKEKYCYRYYECSMIH